MQRETPAGRTQRASTFEKLCSILGQVLPYKDEDLIVPAPQDLCEHPSCMWLDLPGGGAPDRYVRVGSMTIAFDHKGQIVGCGRWIFSSFNLTAVGRVNFLIRRRMAPNPADLDEILPADLSPEAREHIIKSIKAPRAKAGPSGYAERVFAAAIYVNARDRGLTEDDACDFVREYLETKADNRVLHRWRKAAEQALGIQSDAWTTGDMHYPIVCW